MIYFVVPQECVKSIESLIEGSPPEVSRRLHAIEYGSLAQADNLPSGTYVFTGLSLAPPEQRKLAAKSEAEMDGRGLRILNRPTRVRDRLAALRELAGCVRGIWTLADLPIRLRYPLVIACEDVIGSTESPVCLDERDLADVVARMVLTGFDPDRMIAIEVVEQLNAAGGPVRHMAIVHPGSETPPVLRQLVEQAGLDFARIEFAVIDGKAIVWRIDDCPTALLLRSGHPRPEMDRFAREIAALDSTPGEA